MAINIFWIDGFDEIGSAFEKYKTSDEVNSNATVNTYASAAGTAAPFGYGRFCNIVYGALTKKHTSHSYQAVFSAFHMWAGGNVSSVSNENIQFKLLMNFVQSYIKLKLNKVTGKFDAILVRDSSNIYTWQTPIKFGQWHHVSVRAKLQDSNGKVTLAVDGQDLGTYVGDTSSGYGGSGANGFSISYSNNADKCFFVDNWIVAGGLETDPLLPVARVYGATVPNANVAVSWNPSLGTNWECVDETPHNSDSDHNSTYTAGNQDVFSHAAIPNLGTDVLAVKVNCISRKDGDTVESIEPLIRVSGTDYYGTAQEETTSYFSYGHIWQNNPATDLPWTPEEAQSSEFGYRRQ